MAAAHNSMRLASTLRQDAVHWHQGGHKTMLEACAGALHQCQRINYATAPPNHRTLNPKNNHLNTTCSILEAHRKQRFTCRPSSGF